MSTISQQRVADEKGNLFTRPDVVALEMQVGDIQDQSTSKTLTDNWTTGDFTSVSTYTVFAQKNYQTVTINVQGIIETISGTPTGLFRFNELLPGGFIPTKSFEIPVVITKDSTPDLILGSVIIYGSNQPSLEGIIEVRKNAIDHSDVWTNGTNRGWETFAFSYNIESS